MTKYERGGKPKLLDETTTAQQRLVLEFVATQKLSSDPVPKGGPLENSPLLACTPDFTACQRADSTKQLREGRNLCSGRARELGLSTAQRVSQVV